MSRKVKKTTTSHEQKWQAELVGLQKRHNEMLYPVVRVRAPQAIGSGTVLYSDRDADGDPFQTFILTNHHVVNSALEVKTHFDPDIGEDRKKEVRATVDVEFFYYEKMSRCKGVQGYKADVVYYDPTEDLALLKLRAEKQIEFVAALVLANEFDDIKIGASVFCTGCGLGQPPFMTKGMLGYLDEEMDNKRYMLSTAASIFGSSGGALFRFCQQHDQYELIGVPSRLSINFMGFSADAITHMGWSCVPERIYKVILDSHHAFIIDPTKTIKQCAKERKSALQKKRDAYRQRHGVVEPAE